MSDPIPNGVVFDIGRIEGLATRLAENPWIQRHCAAEAQALLGAALRLSGVAEAHLVSEQK